MTSDFFLWGGATLHKTKTKLYYCINSMSSYVQWREMNYLVGMWQGGKVECNLLQIVEGLGIH